MSTHELPKAAHSCSQHSGAMLTLAYIFACVGCILV